MFPEITKQLMPAGGWHVVLAYREESGGIGIDIEKLIAWALVEVTYLDDDLQSEIRGVYVFEGLPVVCDEIHLHLVCAYELVGYFEHDALEKNREYFQAEGERMVHARETLEAKGTKTI
jgi:hypothetical protein